MGTSDPLLNDLHEKAYSKAIRFLSYKPRTVQEVRDSLDKYLQKFEDGVPKDRESIIGSVIQELLQLGYLDDLDYAQTYMGEQKQRKNPRGPHYLRQFLQRKGISHQDIKCTLEECYTREDEELAIERILNLKKYDEKSKLINYLCRRGFNYDVVRTVVDRNIKST